MREVEEWPVVRRFGVRYLISSFVFVLILCIVGLAVYAYHARDSAIRGWGQVAKMQNALSIYEKILTRSILKSRVDNENIIVSLRDYVYRRSKVGTGDFNYSRPVEHLLNLEFDEVSMLCGGIAQTYVWLLSQYDIPARTVQLASSNFMEGRRKYETHVSVEVFDTSKNKWFVSDPTFNSQFQCNGESNFLDFRELYDCKQAGGEVTPVENGKTYLAGRRVNEYYQTYVDPLSGRVSKYFLPYSDFLSGIMAPEINSFRESLELPRKGWLQEALSLYPDHANQEMQR